MLSLTPQGFEDLQETYASRLHQRRREGLCKGKVQEKRKSKREEAHVTHEDRGTVPSQSTGSHRRAGTKSLFLSVLSQNPVQRQASDIQFCE